MIRQRVEDVRDTALKLAEIKSRHPEDYYYIKGWIHCLLQKEDARDGPLREAPAEQTPQERGQPGESGRSPPAALRRHGAENL